MQLAPDTDHPRPLGYALACLTIMIWAGFLIVSRIGGTSVLTAFDTAALRFGVSGTILLPFLLRRGLPNLRLVEIAALTFCAGLGYALLAYGAFYFAPARHGAVLIAGLLPFLTTVFAVWLLRERVTLLRMLGLGLICAGAFPFVREAFAINRPGPYGPVWVGDLMMISASCCWSMFGVLIKRWQVRAVDVTLTVAVTSMLIYLPIYFAFLPKHIAIAPLHDILLQGIYQGMIVVCVAMLSYTMSVELLGPTRMAMMMAMVPVTGALLAVPLLGERLTAATGIGVALVSCGALLGAFGRVSHPRPPLKPAAAD